jgi:hypothetical protein
MYLQTKRQSIYQLPNALCGLQATAVVVSVKGEEIKIHSRFRVLAAVNNKRSIFW